MKQWTYILTALLLGICPSVNASNPVDSIMASGTLDDIVVTGTRTPKRLKDTPIQTVVISKEDIRQSDATNIKDLLQQELPGVEFTYAMGQQPNMNLGGFARQNILILIDGERVAGETMENIDFERITMGNVERIEIIKGASSALYGSNAVGGVINIITGKAKKPFSLSLEARAADHNDRRYRATLGLKGGKAGNVLEVSHTSSDTYTVCRDLKDDCNFRNVFGGSTLNINDRFDFDVNDDISLTARAGYFFRERLYNADAPERYRAFSAGLGGTWNISTIDNIALSYSFDQYDKSDLIQNYGYEIKDYSNVKHSLRAIYNHTFHNKDVFTMGGEFLRDYLETYQFSTSEGRKQYSGAVYAQYDLFAGDNMEITGAGRWDYTDDTNSSQLTGKLSARYTLGDFIFRAGYSGGFRSPSMKERFMEYDMSGIFIIMGNSELKAEKSHTVNVAAEYSKSGYYLSACGYYSFVSDKISTSTMMYSDMGEPYIRYINIGKMNVAGAEITAQGRWGNGLAARITYCYTHEQEKEISATPFCPARPHTINFKGTWDKEWTEGYSTELLISGRFLSEVGYTSMTAYEPFTSFKTKSPAYTIWKAQLTQTIKNKVRINIAIDNIFNYAPKTYEYNSPVTLGANLMVGIGLEL